LGSASDELSVTSLHESKTVARINVLMQIVNVLLMFKAAKFNFEKREYSSRSVYTINLIQNTSLILTKGIFSLKEMI
jgi:hypothetical protein